MRIISKYHDYYDGAMAHGIDPSLIYKRDQELVKASEVDWNPGSVVDVERGLTKLEPNWRERDTGSPRESPLPTYQSVVLTTPAAASPPVRCLAQPF